MNRKRTLSPSRNRVILGVCGGIADYFGLEHHFVRMFFMLTTAASAIVPGVVIYLLLWAWMRSRQ